MDQLQTYYQHCTDGGNIAYNNTRPAQHSWITPDAASDCGHLGSPAGLNEWADSNNILVLYPQAIASAQPRNPEGCWDWWGYTGSDYALKSAPQMSAIMAMVHQITGAQ